MTKDYNTQRSKLVIPEYGRNIQKMIEQMQAVKDKEERTRMAHAIIAIMGSMNPHLRDINDFKHKLWDHLTIIADFNLDIDSPYPLPNKETFYNKPREVPYNTGTVNYKYYGNVIEKIIEKAAEMEEGNPKAALINLIANHMKKSYLTWNKEVVTDEVIFEDIRRMSQGRINLGEELRLSNSKDLVKNRKRISNQRTDGENRIYYQVTNQTNNNNNNTSNNNTNRR